ncbi:MAG: serine/threonine-protein kinase, partial [Pseudonocardiales bacterium]|nr:serine/threonine-protein kinase [Pseudonocardiales bacterium]
MDGVDGVAEGDLVAGRYRLRSVVGIGSSALVRAGRDERTGRRVAVKLIHAHAGEHERRQHRREVLALGRLRHPGVVGLVASGTHAGQPFLVTDLVDGPTLAERITEGPLEPHRVRRIGIALAGALAHVHAAGVVHRDLKPANVLLAADGRPRLADFGISRPLDGAVETDAGTVVGTAAFLAPEQAQGARIGPAADVYALGLVLLEAVTGRREYPGPAAESAVARLHRAPDVPEGLPGAMTPALRAMTAADPGARPSAADVVDL